MNAISLVFFSQGQEAAEMLDEFDNSNLNILDFFREYDYGEYPETMSEDKVREELDSLANTKIYENQEYILSINWHLPNIAFYKKNRRYPLS